MMKIVVRKASLDDVKDIVEVHCSDVVKRFKEIDEERAEANYEKLNINGCWSHGGP